MKPSNLLLACACLLFFVQCRKKAGPPDPPVLPPVTAEGKNKMGFTLDRKVWLPYYPCPAPFFPSPSCVETGVFYEGQGQLLMGFSRLNGNKVSYLEFNLEPGRTITRPGEKIDSITVVFRSEQSEGTLNGYYTEPQPGSTFVINRIDTVNNIISGQFELILIEKYVSGNTIHLKEGRFDYKLPTCFCR
jgi:hypothetical protein